MHCRQAGGFVVAGNFVKGHFDSFEDGWVDFAGHDGGAGLRAGEVYLV